MSDAKVQRAVLWITVGCLALALPAWLLIDIIPPPDPEWSARQWADFWSTDVNLKKTGIILYAFTGTATLIPPILVFQQMRRVEGLGTIPILQLIAGTVAVAPGVYLPILTWSALVFRPFDVDPNTVRTLSDMGFFPFFMGWPIMLQALTIAAFVFRDREERIFPRWVGYLSVLAVIDFVPATFIYFFKDGPLAWNGLLSFWLALAALGLWVVCIVVCLFKAINRQIAEEQAADESAVPVSA
jgi:hypothetical protein